MLSSADLSRAFARLRSAATDSRPVAGLTHDFYRYPGRFSPGLASTAISAFSEPGDLVLDPYMGGGTTIVEAMAHGRRAVGCDLNSLAIFLTSAKCTALTSSEAAAVKNWASTVLPALRYSAPLGSAARVLCPRRTRNLELPDCRPIKKLIALALDSLDTIPTHPGRVFARAVLLNVGQWALNGRKTPASTTDFRNRLTTSALSMLSASAELFASRLLQSDGDAEPTLIEASAESLGSHAPFDSGQKADLVVTSPPYPGIHILYHRWQVDGRKESPAPYWIAGCQDGRGNAFYNFADRRGEDDAYFAMSLRTLRGIRAVTRDGAIVVQVLAFARPHQQLQRYLSTMAMAGFREIRLDVDLGRTSHRRIWRDVPGRRWHARMKGELRSAREVVLVHRAE